MDDTVAMIEIDGLSMRYAVADGDVTVLDDLSLAVPSGERVAIVGPSGSGKTTLLLLLTGLEQAGAGRVSIDGTSLDALDDDGRADLRRERIGIVFQSFHLIPSLTAAENVALPLDIAGRRDGRERATAMLGRVGLGARLGHYPMQLSGGEQQRVAIARALVHGPRLLVADEPTGNLDERSGERVVELLFELNREAGTTLVLVTHDPALAARCDRTLHLHEGRLHPEPSGDTLDTGPEPGPDTEPGTGSNTGQETARNTGLNNRPDTGLNAEPNAEPNAGPGTERDTGLNAGADAGPSRAALASEGSPNGERAPRGAP